MNKFLQLVGWRESPGSVRLFGSNRSAIAFVLIVAISAVVYKII